MVNVSGHRSRRGRAASAEGALRAAGAGCAPLRGASKVALRARGVSKATLLATHASRAAGAAGTRADTGERGERVNGRLAIDVSIDEAERRWSAAIESHFVRKIA